MDHAERIEVVEEDASCIADATADFLGVRARPNRTLDLARSEIWHEASVVAADREAPFGSVVRMRVVAGSARSRKLVAPVGLDVRPTTDRVREATFNALGSLGVVEDARVLDLFAGSGALGIEALSRGAEHCVLVEPARSAQLAIDANLHATGLDDRADVVKSTAEGFLSRQGSGSVSPFDLVLCDPPYDFDAWSQLWTLLTPVVHSDTIAVVESNRDLAEPDGWRITRNRRYGGTVVAVLTRTADGPKHVGAHL